MLTETPIPLRPVAAIRKRLGLTQAALADKLERCQASICAYEAGRQGISPDAARRLVQLARQSGLDISLDHVYGDRPLSEVLS